MNEQFTQKLLEKQLISEQQHQEIKTYQSKNIFSVNAELLFLLYLSVILFTSGVGVFVYKNIDTVGHLAILGLNFILMSVCFFFCFKKAKGYSNQEVIFDNPIYDYVLLTGSILACIFLSYANYQYAIFDQEYQWVSLLTAILCFAVAYYFDNKSVLSMGITAITAFVGISITPKNFFQNDLYNNLSLIYSGVILSFLMLLWLEFSLKKDIKKHFYFVFSMFALHLAGVSILSGLFSNQWYVFSLIAVFFGYYFIKLSYRFAASSLFVFAVIYCYVALNILIGKLLINTDLFMMVVYLSPLFYIGSIVVFIKLVRDFNKKTKHDTIQ
jgi:hypothetical protein